MDSYRLDKSRVRHAFDQAAAVYEQVAVLQREVGNRLVGRLDLMRLEPRSVIDIGAGCGATAWHLKERYPTADVVALDISEGMLKQARKKHPADFPRCVCGDMEQTPCASGGFDLLVSNLTLQWCNDIGRVLTEFARLLRPGGALLFTTFGPDTLKELRASWAGIDRYTHVNAFADMHDIGDGLVAAGLAEPVMDVEPFTLTYNRVRDLMGDLKGMGARNATAGRRRGLTGRAALRSLENHYEQFRHDGRLPATFEVIYGHAWAPTAARRRRVEISPDQLKQD